MEDQQQLAPKKPRGLACLDQAERRRIASLGGKAAHAQGRAHTYSHDEAVASGRKGGVEAHRRGTAHHFSTVEAIAAGRKGGLAAAAKRHGAVIVREEAVP